MLLRNARLMGCDSPVDVRVMHGEIREIGENLAKGLYEAEADLHFDTLTPGRVDDRPCSAGDEQEIRCISREKYREGFAAFRVDAAPAHIAAFLRRPERRGARIAQTDEMPEETLAEKRLRVGSRTPLARWSPDGRFLGLVDEHFAD